MLSRRERRLEAKKRKAEAFLNLVKNESEACSSTASEDAVETKKPKTDKSGESLSAEEMIAAYKQELKERQKLSMQRPKLFLTLDELTRDHPANFGTEQVKQLPPLFITDVQHLLLFALQGQRASMMPRWCRLLRMGKLDKVVVVVLDSVSSEDFKQHGDSLPTLKSASDISAEMVAPVQYGSSVREDLLTVPLSVTQMTKMSIDKEEAVKIRKAITLPTSLPPREVKTMHEQDMFDRTCLLLNPQQMMYEGYPLPLAQNSTNNETKDFVYSKEKYEQVSSKSPIFAIDCEMVVTTERRNELARVSVVNENLECVYDSFVKPENKIIDYVTRFSGITKKILDTVTTKLEDVQKQLSEILPPDGILCGQSLNGDLSSLKIYHPYVIDTSVIYNLTGNRRMKTGLRRLTEHFLRRNIQSNPEGHSSVEDAIATMELVLLKLRNGLIFGDLVLAGPEALIISNHDQQAKSEECQNCSVQENHKSIQDTTTLDNQTNSNSNFNVETCKNCDSDETSLQKERHRTKADYRNSLLFNKGEVERRRTFFQREGNQYVRSFFEVIKKQEKTGKVTDSEDNVSLYADKHLVQTSDSDKGRQLLVNSTVQDTHFHIVHLYGFTKHLQNRPEDKDQEMEAKQKCLWKLDRRVWKILNSVPTRSLFVVILSGRLEDQTIKPALTFAKIT